MSFNLLAIDRTELDYDARSLPNFDGGMKQLFGVADGFLVAAKLNDLVRRRGRMIAGIKSVIRHRRALPLILKEWAPTCDRGPVGLYRRSSDNPPARQTVIRDK